ncbi:hypothetical protein L5515_006344 [Caenorhabditis briggsae]|uniref:Uncharacterized protein n=1 Tax=Caenorhabditis briggsae TaxID=6238 RepID=A0AAE9JJE4_CAEBR|nr:hypothetical protein L5515_006344 [Caenorhabditis briggsae]
MASYSLLLFLTLLGASTHAYMDWETGNERTNVPIWFKQEFKLEYCNNKIINGVEISDFLDSLPAGTSMITNLNDAYFEGERLHMKFSLIFRLPSGRGYEDSPKYEVQLQRKRRALTLIEAKITNCNEIPN